MAHFGCAQRDEQFVVEVFAGVFVFGEVFGSQRQAGFDVLDTRLENFFFGEGGVVNAGFAFDDFAGGEVTVFLRLNQGVFVDRFAKILAVVGSDFLIVGAGVFGFFQLARRGGQADVNGIRVALQNLRPAPPGRAVALVDDDDAEGVFAIVLGQKAGKAFFVIQAERLVGGDMDAGILRTVAAALGADNTGVVAKSGFELAVGLCAQFVAIAQEQCGFR